MKNYSDTFREQFNEALKLKEIGKYDESEKILLQLAEEYPNSAAIYGTLGSLYWNQEKLDKAIIFFKKASLLSPQSELASLSLFHTLWDSNKLDEALEEMKRFLALSDSEEYRSILKGIKSQIAKS
jgi:predicted Zn-dependent protease